MNTIIPTMEEMLKAGVHFGHQSSRWHPKMEPYIYTVRNGVHIFDLKKTQKGLEKAAEFLSKIAEEGGDILFVGTKTQAAPLIQKYAKEAGVLYTKSRWMGGLLTNFDTVKKVILHYLDLIKQRDAGDWDKYTKKEQIDLSRELEKLEANVSGLAKMTALPKALFIVDIRKEKTALLEANACGIPIVALCDSNVNPDMVTYVIPGNDDATKGLELIIKTIAGSVGEGMKNRKVAPPKGAKQAPGKKAIPLKTEPKVESKTEAKAEPELEAKTDEKAKVTEKAVAEVDAKVEEKAKADTQPDEKAKATEKATEKTEEKEKAAA